MIQYKIQTKKKFLLNQPSTTTNFVDLKAAPALLEALHSYTPPSVGVTEVTDNLLMKGHLHLCLPY